MAPYAMVRMNEFYVSQYLDHTPLLHPERGFVLASRQNLAFEGRHPWTLIGALGRGAAYATDALQFYGRAERSGNLPKGLIEGLPSARLQHEHALAAIQEAPLRLAPGAQAVLGFYGLFEAHHPGATTADDIALADKVLALPEARPPRARTNDIGRRASTTLFSPARLLDARELSATEITALYGDALRHVERAQGRVLSFFRDGAQHVVLKNKELNVLRPHAHIIHTGNALIPQERALTSTVWMQGVFHSMVTQGHVGINRFLSTVRGYLGFSRADGLRIFVETADGWRLLNEPSAFEMTPRSCRWLYKHEDGLIAISSTAHASEHALTLSFGVLAGAPVRWLLCQHVALDGDDGSQALPVDYAVQGEGVFVRTVPDSELGRRFPQGGFLLTPLPGTRIESTGGDELLFDDGKSRRQPFLCLIIAAAAMAGVRIEGRLITDEQPESPVESAASPLRDDLGSGVRIRTPSESPLAAPAERMAEILPWFIHNALIHYLAPRGIEQYTGGAWGTRDICQGPVEMLLALGAFAPVRDLLIRVFTAQEPGGDWPQWFAFFERERDIRASDAHGDIVFWPLLALADYLLASEDKTLLEEEVSYYHPAGEQRAESDTIWGHVARALAVIGGRLIPGTHLAAYGNGDWNDSLQPLRPEMRRNLCSAWTVTLHYQMLRRLTQALERTAAGELAAGMAQTAEQIRADFERLLIVDGVLTGFAYFREDGKIDYLLHPRDRSTGLSYRLLPMIHAIANDMFFPTQARAHLRLIREHLLAPDGARLFDRPLAYHGGPQQFFQRAESATFFGREIGLMYTHAHLRYAEALARLGEADAFFHALSQANPIGIQEIALAARARQANCYYSSSDAAFVDRYQAREEYARVKNDEIALEGGWRIYSSGAGIWTRLFHQFFLGLRSERSRLVIDPVIPRSLNGMCVETLLVGHHLEIIYQVQSTGSGPTALRLNDQDLFFTRGANPYRTGAAVIPMAEVKKLLGPGRNQLTITLE